LEPEHKSGRWVRARRIARASISAEHTVLVHLLGDLKVVASARVLAVLDRFDVPKNTVEVAGELDTDIETVEAIAAILREAELLQPAGVRELAQIRALYKLRFDDRVVEEQALEHDRRCVHRPDVTLRDGAPSPVIDDDTTLVLSPALAVLSLDRKEVLARHPLERCLHLEKTLWRIARAFRRPTRIASVRDKLSQLVREADLDVLEACAFLLRRCVLWRSSADENAALNRRFGAAEAGLDLDVIQSNFDIQEMKYRACGAEDLRPVHRTATVALLGGCHVQAYEKALELLAMRRGYHLEIHGFEDHRRLAERDWSLVVVSFAWCAYELYQHLAIGDVSGAARLIPSTVAAIDTRLDALRRETASPILVHSLGHPGLTSAALASVESHELNVVLAEANRRILESVRRHDQVFLLDEDAVVRRYAIGAHWNDEYHVTWHHAPLLLWGTPPQQIPTAGRLDEDGLREIDYTRRSDIPPRRAWQGNPAVPFAQAYLDVLLARSEACAVRLVVFEPNEVLWPGRIEDRPEVRSRGLWLVGPHWPYAGLNEALRAVARRGIALACVSSCPEDVLIERWTKAFGEGDLRPSEVAFIVGGKDRAQALRELANEAGVREEEILLIDLGRPPPHEFRGRAYVGDRWMLRRYLMTAPEVAAEASREPVRVVARADASTALPEGASNGGGAEERKDRDWVRRAVVDILVSQLGQPRSEIEGTEDLRLLGLDSMRAVGVIARLEGNLGVRIADRHLFAPGLLFSQSGLVDASVAAVCELGEREVSSSRSAGPLPSASLEEWTSLDLKAVLAKNMELAPTPWAIKFLRSGQKHDYEYLTWRQLSELAAGYTALFNEAGLARGSVVTIVLPTGVALVAAFVGAIMGDFVPSISAFPNEKLPTNAFAEWFGATVARSQSPFVLCYPELEDELRRQLVAENLAVTVSSVMPAPRSPAAYRRDDATQPDANALLQQSSGTTGLKKAVMLSGRAVLAQTWLLARGLEVSREDVIVSWLPLYHDMGFIACLVLPLLVGVPVVMMSPLNWVKRPELLLQQISEERGTLCWLPNFSFVHTANRVRDEMLPSLDLTSLRAVVSCSEPITANAMRIFGQRFARCGLRRSALSSSYAMAEATFTVTQSPLGRSSRIISVDRAKLEHDGVIEPCGPDGSGEDSTELVSSGVPLAGFDVEVVDDSGTLLGEAHVGEIRLRGPSMMEQYFNDTEETRTSMRDGWYYTGDLGAFFCGELYVTSRKRDLIIVAGQNVYPHFVEEVASGVPGVAPGRVVAFGVFEEDQGTERLVLMAEPDGGLDPERIAPRIAEEVLSRFRIAAEIQMVPPRTLKKSTSGKISRSANRKAYLAGTRS
jgi:fatty-acyl-CoA synthase